MSPEQASLKNLKNVHQNQPAFSICPSGEEFPLPKDEDYAGEFKKGDRGSGHAKMLIINNKHCIFTMMAKLRWISHCSANL
jgi:hypothetical protein